MESSSGNRTRALLIVVLAVVVGLLTWIVLWYASTTNTTPEEPTEEVNTEPTQDPFDTTQNTSLVFIALDDNGTSGEPIGCGDSAILVEYGLEAGTPEERLTRALLAQLSQGATYGESGLHNPLGAHNDLTLGAVTIADGLASVYFEGTLEAAHCEVPRFEAQVEQTAVQFDGVERVEIFVNDASFEDLTDLSGE